MKYNSTQLLAIISEASTSRVSLECRDVDSARKMRYALARRRGPAGHIIIRQRGRVVTAEPSPNPIIGVEIS